MDLFASRGFKGATTRAIAEAAGVSEAIIFRHFATKEDLYDAIITSTIERRDEVWEHETPTADDEQDLEHLLRGFAQVFLRRHRDDQTFIRLMLYSALQDHKFRQRFFESNQSPFLRAIVERIQMGVDTQEFPNVDPQLTVRSYLWSLLQYTVSRFVAVSECPPESEDEAFIQNLVTIYTNSLVHTEAQPTAGLVS